MQIRLPSIAVEAQASVQTSEWNCKIDTLRQRCTGLLNTLVTGWSGNLCSLSFQTLRHCVDSTVEAAPVRSDYARKRHRVVPDVREVQTDANQTQYTEWIQPD